MSKAVQAFGRALRGAGPDAVGLLYYAGHGIQASGANYLLPVGARIETEADLRLDALSASDILAQMEDAGNALNIVILDACRDNPFRIGFRSASRGLARVEAPSGSLIAYAAAPGQVAADGDGANGPYATALARAMSEPGLDLIKVFRKVRVEVEAATGKAQTPWEEQSLKGDFYFLEPKPRPAASGPAPQADREVVFWNSVKDSRSPAVLQTYVDSYPSGTFSGLATVMIDRLKAAAKERERKEAEKLAALTSPAAVQAQRPETPSEMVVHGLKYERGDGLAKDPAMAAKWYREAARSGSAEAKYRLGLLYYRGEGVGRSFTEAAVQILDAVKANHTPAVDAMTSVDTLDDMEFLKAIQQRLKTLGYYRSAIDGKWGAGSRGAVAALARGESGQVPVTSRASTPSPSTRGAPNPPVRSRSADGDAAEQRGRSSASCKQYGTTNPEFCMGIGQ
jgi:uncharacterized caspase-like protein